MPGLASKVLTVAELHGKRAVRIAMDLPRPDANAPTRIAKALAANYGVCLFEPQLVCNAADGTTVFTAVALTKDPMAVRTKIEAMLDDYRIKADDARLVVEPIAEMRKDK